MSDDSKSGSENGRFGKRGWLGLLVGLAGAALLIGGPAALSIWLRGGVDHGVPLPGSHSASPTYEPGYWYCWDVGNPHPHHLGTPVTGDHMCSNTELQQYGTP